MNIEETTGGRICPYCGNAVPVGGAHYCPSMNMQGPIRVDPQPMGCICPPGANKDCEAPHCPRKNPFAR